MTTTRDDFGPILAALDDHREAINYARRVVAEGHPVAPASPFTALVALDEAIRSVVSRDR